MPISFGLSAEQRANRRNFVGGSESEAVCSGDPAQQMPVYLEKIGEVVSAENGTWTRFVQDRMEHAALDWVEAFGCKDARGIMVIPPHPWITRRGEQPTAALHPFIGCTLDGWSDVLSCPLNVKRLNRWTGKKQGQTAIEWAVEKYTVSTMHECLATDSLYGYLILVIDEAEPVAVRVDVDPWVAEEMVARLTDFWKCVETRTPPEGTAVPFVPPKIEIAQLRRIDLMRAVERAQCNWADEFIDLANTFAGTQGAHRLHMSCRDEIKRLLPDDVASVDYGYFHVARTKANSITMKLEDSDAE